MNKRFEHKEVPSGSEVCEAQLVALLERLKGMEATDKELDAYLPKINEVLGDLSRDELIKRIAQRDIARFLAYYRKAPDLNVPHPHDSPQRPDRPDRPERPYERREKSGPVGEPLGGDVVRLRLNIGMRNNLTMQHLMSVINRATPGPKLRVGRVRIMEQDTVVEVSAEAADILMPNLNGLDFHGRRVRAVVETDATHGMGRGHSKPGGFHKRPHRPRPH